MVKSSEILSQQKKQKVLKNEIKVIKKKLPTYIIGFIFFATISLYFLENSFYSFFGKNVDFIIPIIILLSLFSLFFLLRSYYTIKKKQKEAKSIGSKLYKLMKLDVDTKNE